LKYYCAEKEEVLAHFSSNPNGLSEQEAQARLERDGKNKLAAAPGKSLFRRFLEQLSDPMIIILLAAAAIVISAVSVPLATKLYLQKESS